MSVAAIAATMRCPSRMASGTIEKSSRTRTRSATPRVAGLPLCIATPTSAVRTGRMSLTPSPVMATYRPRRFSAVTSRAFRCGSTRPKIVVRTATSASASSSRSTRSRPEVASVSAAIPSWRPIAATVLGSSPDTIFTSIPRARSPSTVARASGRSSSTNVRNASGSSGPGSDAASPSDSRWSPEPRATTRTRWPVDASSTARARTSSPEPAMEGARTAAAPSTNVPASVGWAPSPASKRIADQRSADENGTSATIGRDIVLERGSERGRRVVR